VGAAAAVLPAKSVLCILCHPSPLAIGHSIFWIALIVLLAGLGLMVRFWFKGSVQGEETSLHRKVALSSEAVWDTIFSKQLFTLLKVFFLDILLQRRILKGSVQRWSMHSLIYLAIIARFTLSITTGLLFSIDPDGDLAILLMDKNNAFTAFVYDFLGLCILGGVIWATVQRFVIKPAHVVTEITDSITLGLLGLLTLAGFLTTGARLLLTQVPTDLAVSSFIGFPISKVLGWVPVDWRLAYPYLWYAHAVLGAVFVAYLPFGKLKHIFNVPLTYFMEELSGVNKKQRV
jgi:nitrate reductase gamma subunit